MIDLTKIMPVTRVKKHLLDIIKTMAEEDSTIAITRNGEPVSVMMTADRYEMIMEMIEILNDKEIMRTLESSSRDFEAGKVIPDEEVWQD